MTADDDRSGFSLKRWSRRKREAAQVAQAQGPATTGAPAGDESARAAAPAPAAPAPSAPAPTSQAREPDAAGTSAPLPPVDSLAFDSDFTPFLQPKVDAALKRQALRRLFHDPQFNVMDGLDVYIDDYSLPDPIAPEVVRQLRHAQSLFAPPRTRVNAQGFVEDIPSGEPDAPPEASVLPAPGAGVPSPDPSAAPVESPAPPNEDPHPRGSGRSER